MAHGQQFSLSWEAHKRNICLGLSSLQQNGEFVDMTLAADGHHVKVHQVIIALASPYIKELITSAQCQHPVIFLNKISYTILSAILEYIYTGEALVSIENLSEFVEAGKELHIKGLEDMDLHKDLTRRSKTSEKETPIRMEEETLDDEICYFEISAPDEDKTIIYPTNNFTISNIKSAENITECMDTLETAQDDSLTDSNVTQDTVQYVKKEGSKTSETPVSNISTMQYTVSNQGSLQMILNRFVYYLKHTNRNSTRQWRCVDYLNNTRCPAHVLTQDDVVVQRIASHTHAFHDKKILKKIRDNAIFTAIQEAEQEGQSKRGERQRPAHAESAPARAASSEPHANDEVETIVP